MTGLLTRLVCQAFITNLAWSTYKKSFLVVLRTSARNIWMRSHESVFKGSLEKLIRFSGFFNANQTEMRVN